MSEKLLRILLDELETVRVVCQSPTCGAIVEVSLEALAKTFAERKCRVCNAEFDLTPTGVSSLAALARAIQACRNAKECYRVQFVIPDKI